MIVLMQFVFVCVAMVKFYTNVAVNWYLCFVLLMNVSSSVSMTNVESVTPTLYILDIFLLYGAHFPLVLLLL